MYLEMKFIELCIWLAAKIASYGSNNKMHRLFNFHSLVAKNVGAIPELPLHFFVFYIAVI